MFVSPSFISLSFVLVLSRQNSESRESLQDRVAEKREVHGERSLKIYRGPPSSIQLNTDQYIMPGN